MTNQDQAFYDRARNNMDKVFNTLLRWQEATGKDTSAARDSANALCNTLRAITDYD